jgi:TldD protein
VFGNPVILEIAQIAITEAIRHGALYADVRVETRENEDLAVENSAIKCALRAEEFGLGIRVVANGAWGFTAISEPTRHDATVAARRAVEQAKAAGIMQLEPVQMVHETPHCAIYRTPILRDPMAISLEEKFELLFELDQILVKASAIKWSKTSIQIQRVKKLFLSSEGSEISQELVSTSTALFAGASDGKAFQICRHKDGAHNKGWEAVDKEGLTAAAQKISQDAIEQLTADECPAEKQVLILGASAVASFVRDVYSPSLELDRVMGAERNGDGASFLAPEFSDADHYGSGEVNLYADAQVAGGAGSFGYDDEGVEAQRVDLIKDGRFVSYMCNRETARQLGLSRSSGSARAESYRQLPLIRATNLCLAPGNAGTLEDLIADTKSGILMDGASASSHDHDFRSFQNACETAWEIKDGVRHRRLRNPVYSGAAADLWRNCDAICGPEEWKMLGGLSHPKGSPGQVVGVSNGVAPARFTDVRTGNQSTKLKPITAMDDSVFVSHPEAASLPKSRAAIVVPEAASPAPLIEEEIEPTAKPGSN